MGEWVDGAGGVSGVVVSWGASHRVSFIQDALCMHSRSQVEQNCCDHSKPLSPFYNVSLN